MDEGLVSVRYAKALFLLSKEKNIVEKVYHDMMLLSEQCIEVPEFNNLLQSPVLTPMQKKKTLKSIFEKHIDEVTMNFLGIMIDNKREELLSGIARNYIDFYKQLKGLKSVILYTAFKLHEDHIEGIKEILRQELNAEIELSVRVRDNLIGGFILMADGKMMDASILNKLKKLKKKLLS